MWGFFGVFFTLRFIQPGKCITCSSEPLKVFILAKKSTFEAKNLYVNPRLMGAAILDKWETSRGDTAVSYQVGSECLTCTFRASCCSARLSRAQVPSFAGSSVRDRKKSGRE